VETSSAAYWNVERGIYDYLGGTPQCGRCARGIRRIVEKANPLLNEVRFTPWLSLWRSSREILNHGCKSLRSDFHRAGERMIDDHNGQQPGKDQD
jgi:hypothetical protein